MLEFKIMIIFLATVLFLRALMNLIKTDAGKISREKVLWFLVILLLPVYGPIFYILLKEKYEALS